MDASIAQIRSLQQQYLPALFTCRNVIGCGIGYKVREGVQTRELSLVVSVTHKVHPSTLAPGDLIPAQVDGILTDVVELGVLRAFRGPRDRWRPVVPPGVSIGHAHITAGTFGCLVRRGGELFILSNNHVLADVNKGNPGDPILQPGPADGGTAGDAMATLEEFVPLDFGATEPGCRFATLLATGLNSLAELVGSRHRLEPVLQTPGVNRVDAALARPLSPDLVQPDILEIGIPTGVGEATLGMKVQKSGRTTGHTAGMITQIDATVRIDYYGLSALFEGQLIASPMSQPGDSGSAVLDEDRRVVGLLFAGSDAATIINPIADLLTSLRVEVVT